MQDFDDFTPYIDDDDWCKIVTAYKERYPNTYPDKSIILMDMIETYINTLANS